MCGIAGIILPPEKGTVDAALLERMNARLIHRGPDEGGRYLSKGAGLAMRRLKIIDLEGGRQPIANENGDVITVFNGEIYNFRELRRSLEHKGHTFRSRTDTEVIVHLYEEEGENFVHRLRGMFAIALWDETAQKLLLYRDRLGIKPLHYWNQGGVLAFASEIKSLLEIPEVSREISPESIYDYLSFLYVPGAHTLYRDILRLPPAHFLRWQGGRVELRRYWDLHYDVREGMTEARWADELRAALEESVRLHAISDVPLGSFLSGGVDSSSVTALLARSHGAGLKTYSIGFEDAKYNELPYARLVAKRYGTDHHEQIARPDIFKLLPKVLGGFDEPFADSSALPTYLVSQFARTGVTVALSGDGGDELFAGYLWTRKELWLEKYRQLPASLRGILERIFLTRDYKPLRESGVLAGIRRFLFDGRSPPLESFSRRARCFQPWMLEELLVPQVLSEVRSRHWFAQKWEQAGALNLMDRLLYMDTAVYLPDDLLTKVDRMSMAHSLEVRVPLLDHKVVELAARIPFSLKLKGAATKYIFKQAMRPLIPEELLRQRKQGFSIPLHRWFREDLYKEAERLLVKEPVILPRYFRPEAVKRLLEDHRAGRQRYGAQIYSLFALETWARGRA